MDFLRIPSQSGFPFSRRESANTLAGFETPGAGVPLLGGYSRRSEIPFHRADSIRSTSDFGDMEPWAGQSLMYPDLFIRGSFGMDEQRDPRLMGASPGDLGGPGKTQTLTEKEMWRHRRLYGQRDEVLIPPCIRDLPQDRRTTAVALLDALKYLFQMHQNMTNSGREPDFDLATLVHQHRHELQARAGLDDDLACEAIKAVIGIHPEPPEDETRSAAESKVSEVSEADDEIVMIGKTSGELESIDERLLCFLFFKDDKPREREEDKRRKRNNDLIERLAAFSTANQMFNFREQFYARTTSDHQRRNPSSSGSEDLDAQERRMFKSTSSPLDSSDDLRRRRPPPPPLPNPLPPIVRQESDEGRFMTNTPRGRHHPLPPTPTFPAQPPSPVRLVSGQLDDPSPIRPLSPFELSPTPSIIKWEADTSMPHQKIWLDQIRTRGSETGSTRTTPLQTPSGLAALRSAPLSPISPHALSPHAYPSGGSTGVRATRFGYSEEVVTTPPSMGRRRLLMELVPSPRGLEPEVVMGRRTSPPLDVRTEHARTEFQLLHTVTADTNFDEDRRDSLRSDRESDRDSPRSEPDLHLRANRLSGTTRGREVDGFSPGGQALIRRHSDPLSSPLTRQESGVLF